MFVSQILADLIYYHCLFVNGVETDDVDTYLHFGGMVCNIREQWAQL